MPHLSSPLVVYPKAKQKRYAAVALLLYAALSVWQVTLFLRADAFGKVFTTLALLCCAIWLVGAFIKDATRDITCVIYPTLAIAVLQIVQTLLSADRIALFPEIFEIVLWGAFAFFFVRGICGKCKIIIPMLFLFFGFFYAFIAYDLRAELPALSTTVVLFLILWFVLDAATFTSLPKEETR